MKTTKYFWLLCLTLVAVAFSACSKDDDEQSVQMTISKVYLETAGRNVAVPSREVDFARLGQTLRIEGSGFVGLKKIYINGYETYFNNALVTDNNVWLQLDGKTPVEKAEADVRNTIRFVKDGTQTVYNFTIRAASPSITNCNNTLPSDGEDVTFYGTNLQEVTKITLPGGVEVTEDIVSDEDGEWFTFKMPAGVTECGEVVVEGANGTAKSAPYFNDNRCYIINYDGLGVMGSWSATYGSDDLVDDPLNSGRGKVAMLVPQSVIDDGGINPAVGLDKYWATSGTDATDDWTRMTEFIPASTPLEEVAIQFDIYVPDEWSNTGQLEISLINNLNSYGWGSANTKPGNNQITAAAWAWVPWLDGEEVVPYQTIGWTTVTVPLTEFGQFREGSYTFQDIIKLRKDASNAHFLVFPSNADVKISDDLVYESAVFTQKIYVDNFRVVSIKTETVSDFPEE